ncbi:hypothetical protein DL766_002907 [Monosporascus sp. MC13-8B]|uniref:Small nuclear ribonucleoprotein Prp3 C-terminal domain-containing protein n=1 Tax=Monosporascus cannonballus TaxID=155416 RepID=A0ABY0HCW9_9PEZI|nr:hypothetical protein DL763_009105 [Monosporascus cannonballus]RYO87555.1 hypothetical protein DL762_004201 [Monosporascus cannonballus]RYP34540.1 hypothetical protein DL766_002907 [Monosporascus sp. MC13-8B]
MADRAGTWTALPRDLMELQLGQIDLLTAMYPSEDVVLLNESSQELLGTLREWCDSGDETTPLPNIPPGLAFVLNVEVAEGLSSSAPRYLQLDVTLPLRCEGAETPTDEPPSPKVRIRQPEWMSRAETSRLGANIPSSSGDVLALIEHVKEAANRYLTEREATSSCSESPADGAPEDASLVRAWFYFPSISTRAKRDNLVRHAPAHGLTGFLLAGKPGVLCLEGAPRDVDAYMRFIRTESWGDIPPQHKKVSERYREPLHAAGVGRAFADMQEITDVLGARRGERANRGDMKALEAWLGERGLGEAFAKVLI